MLKRILRVFFICGLFVCLCGNEVFSESSSLIIYCRDAFAESWGKALEQQFPEQVKLVKMPSHGLITRLRLEGKKTPADLLLGIDTTQIREMEERELTIHFPYNKDNTRLPVPWPETTLIPVAYGVLTVLMHQENLAHFITSLDDIIEKQQKIILPDPRTSTTGLEFLYWIQEKYHARSRVFWQDLKPFIVTYTKGLGSSFAMFASLEESATVAYSTSALFAQRKGLATAVYPATIAGAPVQVYGIAVTEKGQMHPLAPRVISYLRSEMFQVHMGDCDLYPINFDSSNNLKRSLPPLPGQLLPPPFLTASEKDALIASWLQYLQE